jgi:hypothetical protein
MPCDGDDGGDGGGELSRQKPGWQTPSREERLQVSVS